jgi:hypothetical protein
MGEVVQSWASGFFLFPSEKLFAAAVSSGTVEAVPGSRLRLSVPCTLSRKRLTETLPRPDNSIRTETIGT